MDRAKAGCCCVVLQPAEKIIGGPPKVDPIVQVVDEVADPASALARAVSGTFHAGPKELKGRLGEMAEFEQVALMDEPTQAAFEAERAALTLLAEGGGTALATRAEALQSHLRTAFLDPTQSGKLYQELELLRAVGKDFAALGTRAASLEGLEAPAERIELSALEAAQGGYPAVEDRIAFIEDFLTRARLTPEGVRDFQAELTVLRALSTGVPQVVAKRQELEQLMLVALLSPEQSGQAELELDALRRVEQAFAHFVA